MTVNKSQQLKHAAHCPHSCCTCLGGYIDGLLLGGVPETTGGELTEAGGDSADGEGLGSAF